ncbi:MAG: hypothetical protein M5U28_44345 [Sandaracinaceae bacterium]|nr:hypothetical protein [Sandaracinaceae bacterium]
MEPVDGVSAAATAVDGCSVVAFGTLPAGDSFDGNATTLDGITGGTLTHQTPERSVTVCDPGCDRHPGWCIGVGHFFSHGRGHDGHDHGCTTITVRDTFVGTVDSLTCFINGSSLALLSGEGTWNGATGYTFDLAATDDSPDEYEIIIYDSSLTVVYSTPTSAPGNQPTSGDITVVEL